MIHKVVRIMKMIIVVFLWIALIAFIADTFDLLSNADRYSVAVRVIIGVITAFFTIFFGIASTHYLVVATEAPYKNPLYVRLYGINMNDEGFLAAIDFLESVPTVQEGKDAALKYRDKNYLGILVSGASHFELIHFKERRIR